MINSFPEAVDAIRGVKPDTFRAMIPDVLAYCNAHPDRVDEVRTELGCVLADRLFDPPLVGAALSLAQEKQSTDESDPILDLLGLYAQSNP